MKKQRPQQNKTPEKEYFVSCCYQYGISHATAKHDDFIPGYSELPACEHVEFLAQMIISIYLFVFAACLLSTSKPGSRIYACGGVHTQEFWHHISGALGRSAPRCFSLFFIIYFHKVNKLVEYLNTGNNTILGQCTGWTSIIRMVHIEVRYVQVLYIVINR